jgi:anti-sigma regulatory factor (Ser/Thr protein kinase)
VHLSPDNGGATVVIEDRGRPFNPTTLPPRIKPVSLDETRIGGVGVHLIRHYSSEMRYERFGECNRLVLTFAPKPAP